MRRRTLARVLVVGALACLGFFAGGSAFADATAEANNNTSGSEAQSGGGTGSNQATSHAGPTTTKSHAPVAASSHDDEDGPTTARIVHEGDNEAEVNQNAKVRSGDAVAGGQVTGIVSKGPGNISVRNSNRSEDAEARSGNATVHNYANVAVGPQAIVPAVDTDGDGIADAAGECLEEGVITEVNACILHDGDNEAELSQDGLAETGDAVAGSQVTGIVSSGGDASVENDNISEDDEAESGEADVLNEAPSITAGPIVEHEGILVDGEPVAEESTGTTEAPLNADGAVLPISARSHNDTRGPITAQIAHDGDNEVEVDQNGHAKSGDAVAGSQVTGLVVSEAGSIHVVNRQSSEDADAESGNATSHNFVGHTYAGPLVEVPAEAPVCVDDPATPEDECAPAPPPVGDAGLFDDTGALEADIAHDGDNEVELNQDSDAQSGDAVAGSSVIGVVAQGGSVSIVADNVSEDAEATSGEADANNDAPLVFAGPIVSDDLGFLFDGGEDFDTLVEFCTANPEAEGCDAVLAPASHEDDDDPLTAVIAHEGDNSVEFDQDADANSGDAVAGSQVIGVVASDPCTCDSTEVSIDASNLSEDAEATSGNADAFNDADVAFAGPIALIPDATEECVDDPATPEDECAPAPPLEELEDAGLFDEFEAVAAEIAHDGDNELEFGQDADANSGDAVAGGQVIGVVGSGDTAIVASNISEDAEAESGNADATNDAPLAFAGPISTDDPGFLFGDAETALEFCTANPEAEGCDAILAPASHEDDDDPLTAVIAHEGDNELELGQDAAANSGDAVAGAQVIGVVTDETGDVSIDASNVSEDSEATSGNVTAHNSVDLAFAGPIAVGEDEAETVVLLGLLDDVGALEALIAHDGDNDLELGQGLEIDSGDAVGGGQVIGVAAGGSVDVVQDNVSEDDDSETGESEGVNDNPLSFTGPLALPEGFTFFSFATTP